MRICESKLSAAALMSLRGFSLTTWSAAVSKNEVYMTLQREREHELGRCALCRSSGWGNGVAAWRAMDVGA